MNEEATRGMFRGLLIVVAVVLAMLALGATVAFADKGGGSSGANAASANDETAAGNQYDDEGVQEDNSGPGNAHDDDDDCVEEDNSGPTDEEDNSGPGERPRPGRRSRGQ